MPCLNLRRLLPPRKMWKVITNKLQLRILHKLNKSKPVIKKQSSIQSRKTSKKLAWPAKPNLSIHPKKFKHSKKPATLSYQCHSLCHLHHRTSPVYVDKLFVQPVSVVKEEVEKGSSSSTVKRSGGSNHNDWPENSSKGKGKMGADDRKNMHAAADEMWESLVLASPQMNGINERAEEFIAKFRAEMQHQEMLARRL